MPQNQKLVRRDKAHEANDIDGDEDAISPPRRRDLLGVLRLIAIGANKEQNVRRNRFRNSKDRRHTCPYTRFIIDSVSADEVLKGRYSPRHSAIGKDGIREPLQTDPRPQTDGKQSPSPGRPLPPGLQAGYMPMPRQRRVRPLCCWRA